MIVDAANPAPDRRASMKKSELIAVGSAVAGVVTGLALLLFLPDLSGWADVLAGLAVCSASYSSWMTLPVQASIIDSKSINA
jgi:hypothetical protein